MGMSATDGYMDVPVGAADGYIDMHAGDDMGMYDEDDN